MHINMEHDYDYVIIMCIRKGWFGIMIVSSRSCAGKGNGSWKKEIVIKKIVIKNTQFKIE